MNVMSYDMTNCQSANCWADNVEIKWTDYIGSESAIISVFANFTKKVSVNVLHSIALKHEHKYKKDPG